MAKPRRWFYEFILLLSLLSAMFINGISHVPLQVADQVLPEGPVRGLPSTRRHQVMKKALCGHCCGSSCWWDERAALCRCPHQPSMALKKPPRINSVTLASLARSQSQRKDGGPADGLRNHQDADRTVL
ncbi:hypothetical protein FHG87_005829 [Trinorchestia longiramus]|nr:hypothetical protein FHG87_005829 [Trinorchestia longiramus]